VAASQHRHPAHNLDAATKADMALDQDRVEAFIKRWTERHGGAERANYALFLIELCDLIGVPRPNPAGPETEQNDYVFERAVRFRHDDGSTSPGRIDLYKKGCFVLEAKQSKKREKGGEVYEQLAFALGSGRGSTAVLERPRAKVKGKTTPLSTWDALMRAARKQAENYARALDEWPPFLIIVDVGHVIEMYADFSRQGKNYAQFPDRNTFRITMADLRSPDMRKRLRGVWEDPFSLDPAKHAAEVTQDIAALLAKMTQSMERRAPSRGPQLKAEWAYKVSKFLMRCIFAMFAEGIGLLPKAAFLKLVEQHKGKASRFHLAATAFFNTMDKGGYSPAIQEDIKKFNGGLFREAITVEINEEELMLLEKAARRDWHGVEPAIFGTLLEQALSERERTRFGAHYTPRTYVERLVVPTIIEPLREDWENVQSDAIGKLLDNDEKGAREAVKKFHDALCNTRVLDPACGSGNFLYVSMELMKRLEGEVLDFLKELGEKSEPLRTVDPHQFLGLELNPRAVPITDLVLWIGYIQWWFRTRQRQIIAEPILKDFGTVKVADAVLAFDKEELLKDKNGRPITRQDPSAMKLHPITGEQVPDPDAKLPVYRYVNPRPAQWPEAEFIVGNPPFIGGKDLRAELGDGYIEALWASRGKKSDSIDYVMYWWDHAATLLTRKGTKLRRFGFITTNSITQKFSRRVLEKHLNAAKPISLVFAVPDHPWQKAPKKAAVRIAMTVAEAGTRMGRLAEVVEEKDLDTDQPKVTLVERVGRINADISLGIDVTSAMPLKANDGLSSPGVKLHGDGFIVTAQQASALGLGRVDGLEHVIKPYLHNRDLKSRSRGVMVVDLFGLREEEVRQKFPAVYQWVSDRVKPKRDTNARATYRKIWWVFGEPRALLRPAIYSLKRIIVTGETSRHRFFEFFSTNTIADNMIRVIASDDAYHLGVLSSHVHSIFSVRKGGWMGVGNDPRYQAECFSSFPFPDATDAQKEHIRALAEELDALRKKVLAEHEFLTMTKLYNVREKLRSGEPLDESEKAIHDAGCVGVIDELHNKIDAAVAEAYGWPSEISDDEIVARLVALNGERAEKEQRGIVRWLRPEYQAARTKVHVAREEQIEAELEAPEAQLPALPKDDADLVATLRRTLRIIGKPIEPKALARHFRDGGKATRRVEHGLQLLAAAGVVRRSEAGWFLPADRAA
jgi:SAM-dependent methyltransferase